MNRDTGDPKTGFGSVLPRHDPDKFKFYDESTYVADYKSHFDYVPAKVSTTKEQLLLISFVLIYRVKILFMIVLCVVVSSKVRLF